eukprot:COSAG05_NODE_6491_length_947_cov_8.936902_2_plen_130_part_00
MHLERKGNHKIPFLVMDDAAQEMPPEEGGADPIRGSADSYDEAATKEDFSDGPGSEQERMLRRDHGSEEDELADEEEDLDGDDTDDDQYPLRAPMSLTRSEEWEGIDDPGYVRIPVLDGLMPFGHEEER